VAEQIVEQILSSARAAGEERLQDAQRDHDERLVSGKAAVERGVAEARSRGRRLVEQDVQQQLSNARLEQHRHYLSTKRRLLDQVYKLAWDQITTGDRYRAWLEKQLAAHSQRGDNVVVSALERSRFETELKGLLDAHGVALAVDTGHFRSGFVIDRGLTRLNCTLDEVLDAVVSDAEIELSQILFK
jgi:vacuolar-type H+-ATPase subunit E/Vma4